MTALKTSNKIRPIYADSFKLIFFSVFPSTLFAEQKINELANPVDASNILAVFLGLTLVLFLFFGLVYVLKKLPSMQGRKSGLLKVIDTVYFGTNEKIILMEVGKQQIVVGINSNSMETLHVLDEPLDVNHIQQDSSFKEKLTDMMQKKMVYNERMKKTQKIIFLFLALLPVASIAEPGMQVLSVIDNSEGGQTYSLSIQILLLMTALTLLPAGLLMMTSFTRIIIVLAILRQALGTAQTPSSQVLVGLALFLTFFVMTPVFDQVYSISVKPYLDETLTFQEAATKASGPMREFMFAQTRETDLGLFSEISGAEEFETIDDVPFTLLVPAFVTSELKTAFQIGFLIFIPFLIIDLVVASVLMSMGMMMLSPLIISFPFKLMLFVLVDGWALIMGTLASSFYFT